MFCMDNAERKIIARRNWLRIYNETGSVTKTALRCGIARSTLYRWMKRSEEHSEPKLSDKPHRPNNLTNKKITLELEALILDIREKRKWGAARISTHLLRTKKIELSPMPVSRVPKVHNVQPGVRRRKKTDYILYKK